MNRGEADDAYLWCGHVHPVHRLGRGKQSWRLPCFHLGPKTGILPAFGDFAGGAVPPQTGVAHVICDGRVEAC